MAITSWQSVAQGCQGDIHLSAGSSKGAMDESIEAVRASCGFDTYFDRKNYSVPTAEAIDWAYVIAGDQVINSADVQWTPGGLWQSHGGLPYGTVKCPVGFGPSKPELFKQMNAGTASLAEESFTCDFDDNQPVDDKNLGPSDHCSVGDPINQATGNNFQIETDFEASGFEVMLQRTYNSLSGGDGDGGGLFGAHWTTGFDRKVVEASDMGGVATITRPHGEKIQFVESERNHTGMVIYLGGTDVRDALTRSTDSDGNVTGWRYTTDDDTVERYDADGRLTSVTSRSGLKLTLHYKGSKLSYAEDNFGQRISFFYNASGRVETVKDPQQQVYKYRYDGIGNLTSIEYPDTKVLRHLYNEPAYTSGANLPFALTGIKDEKNIRFATITYSAKGLAIASEHALHTEKTHIDYTRDADSGLVTKAEVKFGDAEVPAIYKTSVWGNTVRATSADRPCVANPTAKEIEWTYRGQIGYVKDFLDHERFSFFDERNNEYLRQEHVENGNVIDTNFEWHPRWRLLSKLTRGALQVKIDYDPDTAGLAAYTVSDTQKGVSRTWTYKSDSYGRVTEEDGPRDDVVDITKLTYYEAAEAYPGQLKTVTNAAGHTTTFLTYDALGNPLDVKEPNGVIIELRYDPRYRLHTITRNGLLTQLDYDDVGQLETLTLPSKRSATYVYDNARRLTDIKLNDGARIHYTPDSEGNVKRSDVYDANNKIVMTHSATFDDLRQVATLTNGHKKTSTVIHDLVGNLTDVIGPGALSVNMGYDALGRAKTFTQQDGGTIRADYDSADQVWQIKDGNGYLSTLDLNLIGDVDWMSLPASDGYIASQTPDGAGNVKTRVDFRAITEQRGYDELNRIKSRSVTGSPSIAFTYDEGANAKGRLTGLQDYSGTTTLTYDKNGELSGITRKFDGLPIAVGFGHTRGNLTSVTYPSGRVVSYAYANGQLRGVKIGDADFITGITQHPLGMVEGWTWASGATYVRTRDKDGLVDGYTLGSATQTLGYDGMNRLQTITDSVNVDYNQTFGHDLAGRVNSYKGLDAKGKPSDQAYFYDLNGNRKTHRVNGTDYTYGYTQDSNYLETVPGPTPRSWVLTSQYAITDGVNNFSLDAYGRMTGVTNAGGTTTYLLNGLNQRVTKALPNGAKTHFVYGPSGELLAELDKTGQTLKEYIWLPTEADGYPTLVGVSTGANGQVNQVYTDHLGTPRLVTAPSGDALWRWVSDPFGGGAPMETGLKLNLRFAGQYFDSEHGYHYNWNRYYDPATGRYVQSDPIGPAGGINTYVYAGGDPLMLIDPYGLFGWADMPALPGWMVDGAAGFGDSLSFGLTGYVRSGLDIGSVDRCSSSYRNGELADLAFEVGTMGVSAGLKALAAKASRDAVRKGTRPFITAFRNANDLEGGFVHHSNPLFGHPGGFQTTFPTGGLPAALNSGTWNLRWFADSATHAAAHRWMRGLENAWGAAVNPGATGIRAARDVASRCSCRN
jgi:RHS repeat-associated protein